jgi:hypothetical protein
MSRNKAVKTVSVVDFIHLGIFVVLILLVAKACQRKGIPFNPAFRYIDGVLSINNPNLAT